MADITALLKANPQIALFVVLAVGYFAGRRLRIFGFALGTTVWVLLAALVVGQVGFQVPPILKNVAFALFIFTVGYKVGPQFFGSLRKEGIHYLWLTAAAALTALAVTILIGRLMGFDKGTTTGMFAGAMTTSTALGTAEGAIAQLAVSDSAKTLLGSNMAVAYAITYIFGTAGTIVLLGLAPALLRIDLRAEATKLAAQMGAPGSDGDSPESFSWTDRLEMRAYQAQNTGIAGKGVAQVEALFPGKVAVDRIKRGQQVMAAGPEMTIAGQDILLLIGATPALMKAETLIGPEVDRALVAEVSGESLEVCVLNKDVVGKTLGDIGTLPILHGTFLRKATRQGHELPVTAGTVVHKADVLQLIGDKEAVEKAAAFLGYAERPTAITDLVTVAVGCIAGILLGLIVVPVAGIPITLGAGGGVLVAGLLSGWLRSLHPTFGQIPTAAQWLLGDLGLNLFVASIGLSAGPEALRALRETGLSVFLGGIVVTTLPIVVALLVGLKILKMNPVLLFGAATGSHNCTPPLNMLIDRAGNSLPVLGYAVAYAFANVLLTVWGSLIVNLM